MTRCMLHEKNLPKRFWIKRNKLDKKALLGVFIGYSTAAKAFKSGKFVINRDIHFMENEEWNWDEKNGQGTANLKLKFPVSTMDKDENWLNELVDDALTRGATLPTDIYAQCNIAVCEPENFSTIMKDIIGWLQ
ncbi:Retrovirus-related Pol polyprotein from transposon TNT 1-94 [Gossypium australe]|uniref:Retrovirus-related Pol polyprotein from transposon TNT 1-94 n=1 Tax=Gossypium australe TaxID=47621 RepID=A0A5B6VA05_9ROSI|nr:Retrovirus-related Pol polyprotein from transposon TNT 1-94 [Gossypium australe]